MLAKVHSLGISGIDATPVEIEVDVARGLPSVALVGLADCAIRESKERVRSGIKNSGFTYPSDKIIINLAPADMKKEGSAYDLAIAMGILAASEQIGPEPLRHYFFVGELSLNGDLRDIKGALAMALAAKKKKIKNIVLPLANCPEAARVDGIRVYGVSTLKEAAAFLYNPEILRPYSPCADTPGAISSDDIDFLDVKGQKAAKRGLEVAAAGGHNVLLIGPPGSGKTMLARRLTTILPDLTRDEALETTQIHSAMGLVDPRVGLITRRPFRSPHHTISGIALVGGGTLPQPGEISLAHHGVLFMDELPEFHRDALEALRQPLEDGVIRVARASKAVTFPARFMFVGAMNPCPCGYYTDPRKSCRCTPHQISRYAGKISGPLLDRIDIHLEMPSIPCQELMDAEVTETSAAVKERVLRAHKIQEVRLRQDTKTHGIRHNAQMGSKMTRKFCGLSKEGKSLLKIALTELGLSARAYDKILRIARTIADLADQESIDKEHIAEAIQYRSLDRNSS